VGLAVLVLVISDGCGRGGVAAPSTLAAEPPEDPDVFRTVVLSRGDGGVDSYRIPGLETTPKGTLIAVFDVRHDSRLDLPANTDIGIKRSTDGGKTWGPLTLIMDFDQNQEGSLGNGVGDPCIVVDQQTGTIFVAAFRTLGRPPGETPGPGEGPLKHHFMMTKSTDDGLTWTTPKDTSPQVQDSKWKKFISGPGRGIQLTNGALVMPTQYQPKAYPGMKRFPAKRAPDADAVELLRVADREFPKYSCFIWSRDGGATWRTSPTAVPGDMRTTEAQLVQLDDSTILMTMRNHDPSKRRLWARYSWQGDIGNGTWSEPWFNLPDPTCQASLIRHPSGVLLYSNPNSTSERVRMTIRASSDDGRTWGEGRLLDPRRSGYSCMTVLRDGSIGILYECGTERPIDTLSFARFPLDWVTGGKVPPDRLSK
jgi:sialidase-1